MARFENSLDSCYNFIHRRAFGVADIDFHYAFAIKHLQCSRRRDVDRVIHIDTKHLPLGFHYTYHTIALAAHAHSLSQRILIAE